MAPPDDDHSRAGRAPQAKCAKSAAAAQRPARPRGRPRDEALSWRRCAEILDQAGRCFAARGFAGTDVQQVADELGVGKGTVYRYFPSKRELFVAALDRGLRELARAVDDAAGAASDPLDVIRLAVRAYLAHCDAHPQLVELLIQERAERPLLGEGAIGGTRKTRGRRTPAAPRPLPLYFLHRAERSAAWNALLRGLVAAGRVRPIPVERITQVMGDLLYGTMFSNYFAGRPASLEEQADDLLDVAFRGILTDRERAASRPARRAKGNRP